MAYNAILGRWMQRDPLEYAGGTNVYGFADGAPIIGTDPTGLVRWPQGRPEEVADAAYFVKGYELFIGFEGFKMTLYKALTDKGNAIQAVKSGHVKGGSVTQVLAIPQGQLRIEHVVPELGQLYWCHGYTFGGSTAVGGPYSIMTGADVRTVLADEWTPIRAADARKGDIMVFWGADGRDANAPHSGIIDKVVTAPNGQVDEKQSELVSKWGIWRSAGAVKGPGGDKGPDWIQQYVDPGPRTTSWSEAIGTYGKYSVYSKKAGAGACPLSPNEVTPPSAPATGPTTRP